MLFAARFGSREESCPWDQMDDLATEVDGLCCGDDGSACASTGDTVGAPAFAAPASCGIGCAVGVHEFTSRCGVAIHTAFGPPTTWSLQRDFDFLAGAYFSIGNSPSVVW
jgi:hypothetical protein